MTRTTAAEQSLINDTEFLGELEASAHVTPHRPDGLFDPRPMYDDAFDALESGLPMRAGARGISEPIQQRQDQPPIAQVDDEEPIAPQPPARNIPFAAAALVIIACLTAGAATAAFVFHDRLTAVTAALTASR